MINFQAERNKSDSAHFDGLSGRRALFPVVVVVKLQVEFLEPERPAVRVAAADEVGGAHEAAQPAVPDARDAGRQHQLRRATRHQTRPVHDAQSSQACRASRGIVD